MCYQAMRLVQTLDNSIFERSIQSSHIDLLFISIITGPEEVSGHPVYCQPMCIGKICERYVYLGRQLNLIKKPLVRKLFLPADTTVSTPVPLMNALLIVCVRTSDQ